MLPLLKKVAIQNTSTPSTIAVLSNIMEGVDGSGAFNLTNEVTDIKIEDNQTRQTSQAHTLDIRAIWDDAEAAKVDAMQVGGIPAKITAITPDGVVLFGSPVLINRGKVYDDVRAHKYIASTGAPCGYTGTAPNVRTSVYVGKNLLGVFAVNRGQSVSSPSFLNGFKAGTTGASTALVTGSEQTIGITTVTNAQVYAVTENVLFPFIGLPITASANIVSRTGTSLRIGIQFLNSASEVLSAVFSPNTGTGINVITSATPSNTVFVRFIIGAGASSSAASIVFERPMLSIDGSTQFQL